VVKEVIAAANQIYGEPGPGVWITLYSDAGHVYMHIVGLWFDTAAQSRQRQRPLVHDEDLALIGIRRPPPRRPLSPISVWPRGRPPALMTLRDLHQRRRYLRVHVPDRM
jgi:hypothetical protein